MAAPLHILADENIPWVREAFSHLGTVQLKAGQAIQADAVRDVDVLLVRSVTRVDERLLRGSRVRFVGSATIGTDHIDEGYLQTHDIAFAHAPGSNAESVVEYVTAALLRLAVRSGMRLRGQTVGIVGCGRIGGQLADRLPALGLHVLKNDPPLAEAAAREGQPHAFVTLEQVLAEADLVTLHVPLIHEGPHATHHLFDEAVLRQMQPGAWLVNAARGPVVDNVALKTVLKEEHLGGAVLDVWEGEPTPDMALLECVDLATPHIAGYSYDGKVAGTIMLYRAVAGYFGVAPIWDAEAVLASGPMDRLRLSPPDPGLPETDWLAQLVRQMYDIGADDECLRGVLAQPPPSRGAYFSRLRKQYPRRRTFARHTVYAFCVPAAYQRPLAQGLQVRLQQPHEP